MKGEEHGRKQGARERKNPASSYFSSSSSHFSSHHLLSSFLPDPLGMQICRSKDDLEELAQIKVLAMAKLDGAKRLGLTAGDLMG